MEAEVRSVVDQIKAPFEYGHKQIRISEKWVDVPNSSWVRNIEPLWFITNPIDRMRDAGVSTTIDRCIEFEQAIDVDPYRGYYYLAIASSSGYGEEALKWIMGPIAAELNVRKLPFTHISSVISALALSIFVQMLDDGRINRTFAKSIFAEIIKENTSLHIDPTNIIETIIADPKFIAVDTAELDKIVNDLIAANSDKFAAIKQNPKLIQWFIGQTMKATNGKSSAQDITKIITDRIQQYE